MINWLKESNRLNHLFAGTDLYVLSYFFFYVFVGDIVVSSIFALYVSVIAACAVEYKDKLYGNKIDLLDILATILIPIIMMVFAVVIA